jgi:hypothetical protein
LKSSISSKGTYTAPLVAARTSAHARCLNKP